VRAAARIDDDCAARQPRKDVCAQHAAQRGREGQQADEHARGWQRGVQRAGAVNVAHSKDVGLGGRCAAPDCDIIT
jgi:hypothetical protein